MNNIFVFPQETRRPRTAALVRAKVLEAAARREAREEELRKAGAVERIRNCAHYEDLIDLFDVVAPEFRISLTQTGDAFLLAAEQIAGGARSAAEFATGRAHLHALLDDVIDGAADAALNPALKGDDAPIA